MLKNSFLLFLICMQTVNNCNLKTSFITHTFKPLVDNEMDENVKLVDILPHVFDTVNNIVYRNFDVGEFNLVFEIKVDGTFVHILSVLNYSCYAFEYFTDERVLKVEDEIYRVLNDFIKHSINNDLDTITLCINMLSPLKVTVFCSSSDGSKKEN